MDLINPTKWLTVNVSDPKRFEWYRTNCGKESLPYRTIERINEETLDTGKLTHNTCHTPIGS